MSDSKIEIDFYRDGKVGLEDMVMHHVFLPRCLWFCLEISVCGKYNKGILFPEIWRWNGPSFQLRENPY